MESGVTLTYLGPNVDDHTIALDDLLPSIKGFYSSLKIINNYLGYEEQIELRLENIADGSVVLKLKAIWKDASPDARLAALTTLAVPVITVVSSQLINVITFKKHLQGLPINKVEYSSDNVVVYNINNSPITISPKTFELAQDENLTKSLSKYVQPLNENRIDETTFVVVNKDEVVNEATISADEKFSFSEVDESITKTEQVKIKGQLLSLNKQRNTGSFLPEGGGSVRYKLATDSPQTMYYDFAYNGVVEVTGLAKFNSEEKMVSVEIFKVDKLQQELPFNEVGSED